MHWHSEDFGSGDCAWANEEGPAVQPISALPITGRHVYKNLEKLCTMSLQRFNPLHQAVLRRALSSYMIFTQSTRDESVHAFTSSLIPVIDILVVISATSFFLFTIEDNF